MILLEAIETAHSQCDTPVASRPTNIAYADPQGGFTDIVRSHCDHEQYSLPIAALHKAVLSLAEIIPVDVCPIGGVVDCIRDQRPSQYKIGGK